VFGEKKMKFAMHLNEGVQDSVRFEGEKGMIGLVRRRIVRALFEGRQRV